MVKKKAVKKKVAKKKTKKEKVEEVFEVRKKGEEKLIEKKGSEEIPISNKNQIDQQNKLLKQVLFWLGFIIFLVLVFTLISYLRTNFKYDDVEFEVVKDSGGIIFFKTSLPVVSDGKNLNYNFYLRNDPKDLKNVRFEGKLDIKEFMVMNYTNEFSCEGYGAIAIANMNSLYNLIGTKVMKDDNATCDEEGRYMFVKILAGEKTKIERFGPSCYNLYVKDCEILKATERFMLETFVKIDDFEDEP